MTRGDEFLLGLKKGESIPMERHGEMGRLYRPKTQLSADELRLYASVYVAWGERDLGSRDNVVKLVEELARETLPDESVRATIVEHVMAFIDEIQAAGM